MRSGLLPSALLFAALGLALAFAPRRTWWPSLLALAATAAATSFMPISQHWHALVSIACWIGAVVCATVAHWPRRPGVCGAVSLSLLVGACSGALTALSGSLLDLTFAWSGFLVLFPAACAVDRRAVIVPKVLSSWLIAVALLASVLQCLPVTSGDVPDHLE